MLGKAIFGNPWLFNERKTEVTLKEKLEVMIEHTKLFEELFIHSASGRASKNFSVMKKHFKAYVNDFSGAKELRIKLMDTKNSKEVEKIITIFLKISD